MDDSLFVQKAVLYILGWAAAISLAVSFYRWRQRKFYAIRAAWIERLDVEAKLRKLNKDERALRERLVAENHKNAHHKPRNTDIFDDKQL